MTTEELILTVIGRGGTFYVWRDDDGERVRYVVRPSSGAAVERMRTASWAAAVTEAAILARGLA